jgi:hypothetical protein
MGDDELTARLLDDLAETMALRGRPGEVRISRWPDSLAQYRPGHLGRVDAIEVDLAEAAPGLGAAGAWGRGVGVRPASAPAATPPGTCWPTGPEPAQPTVSPSTTLPPSASRPRGTSRVTVAPTA